MISFVVPGRPTPWARAGRNGKRSFTPHKQRAYMKAIVLACKASMKGMPPLAGPIKFQVVAQYYAPRSTSAKSKWRTGRPDVDNLAKLVADALNTIAFEDDAQIVSSHIWKIYGETAELRVKLETLT